MCFRVYLTSPSPSPTHAHTHTDLDLVRGMGRTGCDLYSSWAQTQHPTQSKCSENLNPYSQWLPSPRSPTWSHLLAFLLLCGPLPHGMEMTCVTSVMHHLPPITRSRGSQPFMSSAHSGNQPYGGVHVVSFWASCQQLYEWIILEMALQPQSILHLTVNQVYLACFRET